MMTVVTGQRAASESEIQEGDVPPEGQPDPTKVQLVDDDDGECCVADWCCCLGGAERCWRCCGVIWWASTAVAVVGGAQPAWQFSRQHLPACICLPFALLTFLSLLGCFVVLLMFWPAEIPQDPYIESTGYWQDISVDQSDDDVWKTTDMGWGVYPEGIRKMLNYIQVSVTHEHMNMHAQPHMHP